MAEDFPTQPHASYKEIAICSVITIAGWLSSFSLFFPLFSVLYLSSWARDKFFAYVFSVILSNRITRTQEMRERLFREIQKSLDHTKEIRYLEIGVGNGLNFKYYSGNYSLTLLDKNVNFKPYIEDAIKKCETIKVDKIIFSMAEDMKEIGNEEFDVVIATRFFCSANDIEAVLKEIKRVLKPGGKLGFFDHIAYPKGHPAYWIQRIATPLWVVYGNGCHLDRDWKVQLQRYFSHVSYNVMYPTFVPMFLRPHVIGIATK